LLLLPLLLAVFPLRAKIAGKLRIDAALCYQGAMHFVSTRYWFYFYFAFPKPLAEGLNSI